MENDSNSKNIFLYLHSSNQQGFSQGFIEVPQNRTHYWVNSRCFKAYKIILKKFVMKTDWTRLLLWYLF